MIARHRQQRRVLKRRENRIAAALTSDRCEYRGGVGGLSGAGQRQSPGVTRRLCAALGELVRLPSDHAAGDDQCDNHHGHHIASVARPQLEQIVATKLLVDLAEDVAHTSPGRPSLQQRVPHLLVRGEANRTRQGRMALSDPGVALTSARFRADYRLACNAAPDLFNARLSYPYLRSAASCRCRAVGPPVGLGPPQTRSRPPAVYRPARPLWRYPVRDRRFLAAICRCRRAKARKRRDPDRYRRGPLTRYRQPQARHWRGRARDCRDGGPVGGSSAAVPGQCRGRIPRRDAPRLPLSRPAARAGPRQHHAACAGHRFDPPPYDRTGLQPSFRRRS